MAKFDIKTVKPKFVVTTAPETKIDVSINRPIITAKNQKAYFKLKNTGGPIGPQGPQGVQGPQGPQGPQGQTGAKGDKGDKGDAGATGPQGPQGPKGDQGTPGAPGAAATVTVGTTTTGAPGTNASVTNSGTSSAAVLNFTIPRGAKGEQGIQGPAGDPGTPGAAATIAVGSTQTGNPGTSASVVNSGTSSAAVLDFTIPRGAKGDQGNPGSAATVAVGTVTTGLPGTSATVTNVGTSSAAVFDFTIPRGDKGEAGSGSGDMLASDYDPNGTVANAGGIVDYVTAHEPTKTSDLVNDGSDGSAAYLETDETAYKTASIPYGACDPSSTTTAYTATVPGVTELRDGVCMWLKNGVATSAAGFTIDINGLGAKPVYNNMAAAGRETTLWNVNYTMFFVYDSTRVEGGCWMLYRGYNSDNNTIGYQLRTNSYSLPMTSIVYRYRLLFTSADGEHFVPSNNSTSTNATASRTVCQDPIDPFGNIVYYSASSSVAAGSRPSATALWSQYTIALGYSFNRTGAALVLTLWKPVYIKCAPQSDGSAIIDSTTPYVQDLPSTEDGKIYIFLGVAYTTANIELLQNHPVYYYKDGQIRLWTNAAATGGGGPTVVQTTGQSTTDVMSQKAVTDELALKADASSLATVATSGSYNDLSNKPTIPAAQVNSDWSANSGVAQILNKPTLATVATSGSYNDLSNKPTIPTVNNATLTIQKNGANVQTFTANQSTNATANITVPTKTSDLTNDGADNTSTYVEADELATVATTGAYGDLSGTPTIPTVNDATLTIKQNGASLGTFTANASSNATIDVNAPKLTSLVGSVQTSDYHRSVVALCEVASGSGSAVNSWSSGKLIAHRNNGAYGVAEVDINIEAKRATAYYSNVSYFSNIALLSPTANINTDLGFRPCTFKYNNVYYAGIEFYISSSSASNVYFSGVGNFDVFGLDYYSASHGSTASSVLNSEVYNSLSYTQWNEERNQWRVGRATRDIIYNNGSGTNANFSTTTAMSNYDEVEISYRDGNQNYAFKRIPGPAGSFVLDVVHPGANSVAFWYISRYLVSGTNITVGANNMRKAIGASSITTTAAQDIYITRIVGIRH